MTNSIQSYAFPAFAGDSSPQREQPSRNGLRPVNTGVDGRRAAMRANAIDAWARHALVANGFGDAPVDPLAMAARGAARRAHGEQWRRFWTIALGMLAIAIRTIGTAARRALMRYRKRQLARVACHALEQLDDRGLHDIGFDRSEITSIAAELCGQASATRIRLNRRRAARRHLARA